MSGRLRSFTRHLQDRTFRSLRDPNYRPYFFGQAVSVVGTWMQRVAQDWLVLSLTSSGVALGIAGALQFGPTLLLGLWGGSIVDRVDRRRLIIGTQAVQAALAAALATVTLLHVVQLWMVYLLAFALGVVTVFDNPARQAFVAEMVRPDDYINAQALNSTVHNAGRLVGPALAGLLIATTGVGAAFAVNAVSFGAVLVGLLRIDPRRLRRASARGRRKGGTLEGLRYVLAAPDLTAVIVLVGVVGLFGQNFRVVLPLLARGTFHGGAQVYGYLTAALGLGAVLGALYTASRQSATGRQLGRSCLAFALVNVLASLAPNLLSGYAAMVLVGFANLAFNTLARSVLQLRSDPVMHGRVLGLHSLVFLGSTPLGGPLLGWVCERWGARTGLVVAGVSALAAYLVMFRRLRGGPGDVDAAASATDEEGITAGPPVAVDEDTAAAGQGLPPAGRDAGSEKLP